MSFSEDNLLIYLENTWNADTVDKPATFTSDDQLLNYADSLHVKRHRINNAWIAAGVKRAFDYYEITLQHDTEAAIDELERILLLYPNYKTLLTIDCDDTTGWTDIIDGVTSDGDYIVINDSDLSRYDIAADYQDFIREIEFTMQWDNAAADADITFDSVNAVSDKTGDILSVWKHSTQGLIINSEEIIAAGSLSINTDYTIKAVLDFVNYERKVYVDDVLKATQTISSNTSSNVEEIFAEDNIVDGHTVKINDIYLRTYPLDNLPKKISVEIEEQERDYVNYYKYKIKLYVINYE